MDEYYQQAIDIVTQEQNWKAICISVAKLNPKLLCDAVGLEPWQVEARTIYLAQGKVPAIKHIRACTGLGLKEAKEIADKFSEELE